MKIFRILPLALLSIASVVIFSSCASLNDMAQPSPTNVSLTSDKSKSKSDLLPESRAAIQLDANFVSLESAIEIASNQPQLIGQWIKKSKSNDPQVNAVSAEDILKKKVIKSKAYLSDGNLPCYYLLHVTGQVYGTAS